MLWVVEKESEKEMESRERLRSVCPVRLLPLHNLWAAGADHHGSVPQAAPGAVWDRPVNWMLCPCWARKAPFYRPAWETNQPRAQPATFELCRAPDQQKTRDGSKKKKKGEKEKMAGPSVAHSLSCQSFHPLSPPTLIDTHQPLPALPVPRLHTHTYTVPTPAHIPPQCLLHYRLQCFSAPQPYAQRWGPPVTQHHTN